MLAVQLDVGFHAGGQGVHHRNTNTVQTTGNGVRIGVELTAGVQLGHNNLHGWCTGWVHIDGNSSTVIDNLNATIFQKGHFNLGGVASHGLIH